MSLKFYHIERLEKHINELKELRYKNIIGLNEFVTLSDDGKQINQPPVTSADPSKVIKVGEFWSGRDTYVWLAKDIQIPDEWENEEVVGLFDFGKTGGGHNSGFESLLYVNGTPYQGVDSNHEEVFFDIKNTGKNLRLDFRLWSGLEGGGQPTVQIHQIKRADIACLDPSTDDLYYTGNMIIETIKILDESNYQKHHLQNILIKTLQMVDFTNSRSQRFYDSIKAANDYLNNELDKINKESDINVFCVGHTHIDVAWLWRLKHTREKLARSFSTVNRLMDKYDDYTFLQSQPQLYEYIKHDFPEIYEFIKQRIQEGKWEPSGSMWVEADCNLTSGESIVRQILFAKRFFKKEFNYENTFLWLPDVFGYSWALPQILKKSNIDTFITTKISWNEHNRLPYDTFIWRGIDGSEILTHFITTPDQGDSDNWYYTYNGLISPETIKGIWDNYRNKDLNTNLLISYGYGDGGGGVNRDMLENKRRIEKIPGLPNITNSNVTNYLKCLHDNINDDDNNGYLHTWDQELYLEFHRGTYTSQAYNKKMNRMLELHYRNAELLQVLTCISSGDWDQYNTNMIEEGWKIILRNQFHDILPGSSIQEVYQDCKEEYTKAKFIVDDIINQSLEHLVSGDERSYTVFNSSSWNRNGIVSITTGQHENGHFEDEEGHIIPVQVENNRANLYVENIPALSFKNIYWKEDTDAISESIPFIIDENKIQSNKYIIEWNEDGHIVKIFDKQLKRNALKGSGNVFQVFEDKPRQYDAWELEPTIDLKKDVVKDFRGAKLISSGSNYIKVKFEWDYNQSTISQYLILYNGLDRIDFETTVDWQEREKLLKVAFPVDVRSTKARYDIQYGNVERPTHRSTSWDHAKYEVVGHQWADLSEKGFGVALFNNCKYGYDIKDNMMRLSLLKSSNFPDPEADKGIQQFTYSIYVHANEWYDSNLIQEAWDLNSPLIGAKGSINNSSLFEIINKDVAIDAIKKSEDGNHIIVRMHEQYGGKTDVHLKLNFDFKCWYEVDLMENKIGCESQDSVISLPLNPYELSTLLIEL